MKTIKLQLGVVFTLFLFVIYYVVFSYVVPFNWYVAIDKDAYRALDVCVGDEVVIYETKRIPRWGIRGDSYSQIIRFDNELKTETTIHRGDNQNPVTFGYEPDTEYAIFETTWFYLKDNIYTWPKTGVYGANEWVTIYPLPFIEVSKFNKAEDAKFTVRVCD